jgi:hypothetical protein
MAARRRADVTNSRRLFRTVSNRSGVYMIAPAEEWDRVAGQRANRTMLVKVGLAKNLEHRLNSYLLYWPRGFYVFGILFTDSVARARVLEYNMHAYMNMKGWYEIADHSHDEEWFHISYETARAVMGVVQAGASVRDHDGRTVFPVADVVKPEQPVLVTANASSRRPRRFRLPQDVKRAIEESYLADAPPTVRKDRPVSRHRRDTAARALAL